VSARIDRIGQLFRAAYHEPRGLVAAGYRDLGGAPPFESGPHAYAYRSLYLGWYCNPHLHKLLLGTETATWAYAFVNQVSWFAEGQKGLTVRGEPTFLLTRRVGDFRGLSMYEGLHNQSSNTGQTFSRTILVSRPGRSPLKSVTRREFLEGYVGGLEAQLAPMIAAIEKSSLAPAKKATLVQERREQIGKLEAPARARLAALAAQESEQPAFLSPASLYQFKDFTPESRGGRALVRLDRTYFDPALPRYAPQFIVVYWRWQRTVPSESFRTEFERRFDPSALAALLDH
jgi:hypothetical protein